MLADTAWQNLKANVVQEELERFVKSQICRDEWDIDVCTSRRTFFKVDGGKQEMVEGSLHVFITGYMQGI